MYKEVSSNFRLVEITSIAFLFNEFIEETSVELRWQMSKRNISARQRVNITRKLLVASNSKAPPLVITMDLVKKTFIRKMLYHAEGARPTDTQCVASLLDCHGYSTP